MRPSTRFWTHAPRQIVPEMRKPMATGHIIQYPLGVGSVQTRVLEVASPGPSIVFLHGVGARADRWRDNLADFAAAGYHPYAVDLPGHGLATKGMGFDYSVNGYARFVRELLDVLAMRTAVLIGTSLGAHIASMVACNDPDRVAALVLVGPMGIAPVGAASRAALAENVRDRSRAGIESKLRRLLFDGSRANSDWVDEEVRINTSPGAEESFEALAEYFLREIDNDVVGGRLRSLNPRPPIQLVWGAHDVMVPTALAVIAREVLGDDVPLALLPEAGHAPYLEQPEIFAHDVLEFLAAVAPPSSDPQSLWRDLDDTSA